MRQRVRFVSFAVIALAVAIVGSTLFAQAKLDITGAWIFTVDTGQTGTPTVTFKQDGEKLTGHYSSQTLGEADLTGTLKGQDLNFSFTADLGGQSVAVVYKGTVASNTDMKGTLDVAGGMASGTFTAKRK
ncbi:MAG TPA: hypothetical protein VHZ73_11405 [Vicinamibacterales bacterium]|jgi:hypothetical protein|nr:hypothetical protein [Vicinamibacterales bacterium]